MKKLPKSTNVDAYIAAAPKEVQSKLQALRAAIKAAAPKAEEQISYGMPYYGYKGRLAYFAYAKHHIGLYAMPPIVKDHAKELRKYKTATYGDHALSVERKTADCTYKKTRSRGRSE